MNSPKNSFWIPAFAGMTEKRAGRTWAVTFFLSRSAALIFIFCGCQSRDQIDPRRQLQQILGVSEWRRQALRPEILERSVFKGVEIEKLSLKELAGARTAYVIKTAAGPLARPCVAVIHGHYSKATDIVGLTKSKHISAVGLELAKNGFIVLAPDIEIDYRDMKKETKTALLLAMESKTLMGQRVESVLKWVHYLRNRPDAERGRMGCLGWSMGGQIALYATAFDPDINAVYISNAFDSYRWLSQSPLQSPDNYIPGIWRFGDKDRVGALVAPRPLLIEHASNDATAPFETVEDIAHSLVEVYEKIGAHDRLMFLKHHKAHNFSGSDTVIWFSKWLRPE
ncbi:MAG: dienelactone hydrolase family protein [Elusimicrobiota bacterium]